MEEMKYAVQAVIFNSKGEVLGVSRKDNHSDFGLPGGKVDPEDFENGLELKLSPLEAAIKRELKEETGLDCNMNTAELVFAIHKDGYMSYTYLIKDWEGAFDYDEPHVVMWLPFWRLTKGSFGKYNTMVQESLDDMGVEYWNENPIEAMKEEITEYIGSTKRKGYTRPFKFSMLGTGPGCTYVHIVMNDYAPDEDWDDFDEDYDAGLQAIGDVYGMRLRFPHHYYCK